MGRLLLLFFLSGTSGLIYQVIWVRFFGRVFGNTLHSAALVTAVFMLGLGLGSYWAGRFIDRRDDPRQALRYYGYFELSIGCLGLLLALVLPALEPLAAWTTQYAVGPDGWRSPGFTSHVSRALLVALLLSPPSLLMGGTLTLLIRYVIGADLASTGARVGALYGANTGGAALGALLTDLLLIPRMGLLSTEALAVAFNLVAALGALQLAKRDPGVQSATSVGVGADRAPANHSHRDREASSSWVLRLVSASLLLSGIAGMGAEILWFRVLSVALGSYRAVFSLLLSFLLACLWFGSLAAGRLERRYGRPMFFSMLAQTGFVLTLLLCTASYDNRAFHAHFAELRELYQSRTPGWQDLVRAWVNLVAIARLLGPAAFLMGFSYPLANAHVQRAHAVVGERAGLVYLANTVGAVLGSLVTGFLLVPWLGSQRGTLVLAVVASCGVALAFLADRAAGSARMLERVAFSASAVGLVTASIWFARLPEQHLLDRLTPADPSRTMLTRSEGLHEVVAVFETRDGARVLSTDGHDMSSTGSFAQRYMRAFAHGPLMHLERPSDALVICFGVGSTMSAVARYPSIERMELVDISRHVLDHASYFEATNESVLHDPRLTVFVNDGRNHLWTQPAGRYDLVTLEPPPISFAGVSALYSRDFYALVRSRLKPGGFLTQWLPIYQVPGHTALEMVRAFIDVFPQAILLSGYRAELILVGSNTEAPVQLDPVTFDARMRARPAVARELAAVELGDLTAFAGMFVAGPKTLHEATAGSLAVTDDYPSMEYSISGNFYDNWIPAELFAPRSIDQWCSRCFAGGAPIAAAKHLDDYLAILEAYYRSESFLHFGTSGSEIRETREVVFPPGLSLSSTVVREQPYLRGLFSR